MHMSVLKGLHKSHWQSPRSRPDKRICRRQRSTTFQQPLFNVMGHEDSKHFYDHMESQPWLLGGSLSQQCGNDEPGGVEQGVGSPAFRFFPRWP